MDNSFNRLGSSKPPVAAKEHEKCKTKAQRIHLQVHSKIAGLAVLPGCERTIFQTLFIVMSVVHNEVWIRHQPQYVGLDGWLFWA